MLIMSDSKEVIYYAVHIPEECPPAEMTIEKKDCLYVYTNKEEVLNLMKIHKKARFKQFKSRKEAEDFSLHGAESQPQDGLSAITDSEKVMPFKRPKIEEMIQFRKDIERGNIEAVKEKIYENPKYLVSNGDTPSILQEGSRYNALHIAAKSKNAEIASLILNTITCIDFIGYLYDDNDMNSCISRSEILLDRYLNTPDKGSNETPLHIASKLGAVEVVKVLLSYSQCQKNNIYNRYNELPKDVICSRANGPCEGAKAAIAAMLEEQYFVPVLRSEDNSLQPRVGEAFSLTNPLKLETDLLSPRLEIQAYAGPMSKEKADLFKRKWKTPSKLVKDSFLFRLKDTEKGLEKSGRKLASELKVPWQEYWPFLDTFIDISSPEGLQCLENYLRNRFLETMESGRNSKIFNSSMESNEKNCSVLDLCNSFETCISNKRQTSNPIPHSKRHLALPLDTTQEETVNKNSSEFLKNDKKNFLVYVERSCEVLGKRIGAAIISCIIYENHSESLRDCLETEVKHLHTLIKSYKEDSRFQLVDFQRIHSRVAAIAIQSLQDITEKDKRNILNALNEIDLNDGTILEDKYNNYNYRNNSGDCIGVTNRQLQCLIKNLKVELQDFQKKCNPQLSPSARGEIDCQILWSLATSCSCTWSCKGTKRLRSGLKRKQFKSDCDCNLPSRRILFENEMDDVEFLSNPEDDSEDEFYTPPSSISDAEEMQDAKEIPNIFIYPGPVPTKADFAVFEAIEKVPLSLDKYPNIYLWKQVLEDQSKNFMSDHSPDILHRKILSFESPKSSPRKFLERSFGNCESPQTPIIEPWERVTGAYSPRRSMNTSLSLFHCENFLMSR